jgi:hypothetical protein
MTSVDPSIVALSQSAIAELDREGVAPARSRVGDVAWGVALVLVLGAYAGALAAYYVPAIVHPDSNGYWAQASLLMQTGRTWFRPESHAQYIGMHWLVTPGDVYISRYPPGLAVVIGVVWKLFGWQASLLVNPVLAVLTLVGVNLVVRRVAGPGWGVVAVVLLAMNPPFTVHALTNISHMPVAFCLVWGIYLLQRWSAGGRVGWAFAAGLVLGCIPTIRYADSVVALGVAVYFLYHWRAFPGIHRHYLAALAGAAVPVVPLLIRNQLLLGAFWRTGYALTNEQTGFGWNYFTQNAVGYLQSLQSGGLGWMFALGLIGMVWLICTPRDREGSEGAAQQRRPLGLLLLFSTTPLLVVYMAYYWAQGINRGGGGGGGGPGGGGMGGALRFLVPLIPAYVVAGTWAVAEALRGAPRAARVAVPLLVIAAQGTMYGSSLLQELRQGHDQKAPLALATVGLQSVTSPGDVVLANGGVLQNLDFVRQWNLADPSLVNPRPGGPGGFGGPGGPGGRGDFGGRGGGGAPGAADRPFPPDVADAPGGPDGGADPGRVGRGFGGPAGRPPGAGGFGGRGRDPNAPSPMQAEKNQARAKLYTGSVEERQAQFAADVRAWAGGHSVYVVGNESDFSRLLPGVPREQLVIVKRIATPKPPADRPGANGQDGPGGPGGMGPMGGGFPNFNLRNGNRGGGPPFRGGGGGGGGGPFGPGLVAGEDILIARWDAR